MSGSPGMPPLTAEIEEVSVHATLRRISSMHNTPRWPRLPSPLEPTSVISDLFDRQRQLAGSRSDEHYSVSYAGLGPATTAIRTDATLAARYDRTSATLVPLNVTRIDITQTLLRNPAAHGRATTATDPALLTKVTAAFNTLVGAAAHAVPTACGSPAGTEYVYAVPFHWPGHTLAVDPGAPLCGVGMGLTLDGNRLPQTLDDDSALDAALQATLDAS